MKKRLAAPLKQKDVLELKLGDFVYISGKIFTARDAAHRKMSISKALPFDLSSSLVLFHAGPIMKKEESGKWRCIALGPTTSSRMNDYEPDAIRRFGIRAIIGKGGMNKKVAETMGGRCVYLAFTGGCAAVGAAAVKNVVSLHWPELGMAEGVWELEVKDFGPLVVAIDSKGKTLYKQME